MLIVIVLLVVFGLILYFSHKKRKRAQEEAKQQAQQNGRQNQTPHGFVPTSRNNPFDQIGKLPSRDHAPPKQPQSHQQSIDQPPHENPAEDDISPL